MPSQETGCHNRPFQPQDPGAKHEHLVWLQRSAVAGVIKDKGHLKRPDPVLGQPAWCVDDGTAGGMLGVRLAGGSK